MIKGQDTPKDISEMEFPLLEDKAAMFNSLLLWACSSPRRGGGAVSGPELKVTLFLASPPSKVPAAPAGMNWTHLSVL